jgi:hypothetical protein
MAVDDKGKLIAESSAGGIPYFAIDEEQDLRRVLLYQADGIAPLVVDKSNQASKLQTGSGGGLLTQLNGSRLKNIGHVFSAANTDEDILIKPADSNIGVVYILAEVASGLTSPTVTIKDSTKRIGKWSVPSGDAISIITSTIPLELDGDLVAQVSDTGITLSAWADAI